MAFNTYMSLSSVQAAFSIQPSVPGVIRRKVYEWPGYYEESKNEFIFYPSDSLAANTLYRVTIDTSLRDPYGVPMREPYTWSFVTRPN